MYNESLRRSHCSLGLGRREGGEEGWESMKPHGALGKEWRGQMLTDWRMQGEEGEIRSVEVVDPSSPSCLQDNLLFSRESHDSVDRLSCYLALFQTFFVL